ncbi:MAG TPA: hypothetical protein VHX68_10050 [Planctomycetaceae bacterium]|jgi:hypothetical protein|nr:hypothetical protein [Planctomycetaceae bacterium]
MQLVPSGERLVPCLLLFALAATAGSLIAQQKAEFAAPLVQKVVNAEPPEAPDVTAMRALRSKTAFHVEIMPLAEFAKFLSKKYSLSFKLDPDGLKRARVNPSTPVSVDIDGVPLSAALKEVLGRLELTHRVVNGEIFFTESPPEAPVVAKVVAIPNANDPNGQIVVFQPQQNVGLSLLAQLPVELRFVKRVCAPTTEQMRAIKAELEQCLRDAGKGLIPASCELLPDEMAACVTRHLSPAAAEHYLDEIQKRRAREREACIYTFVTLLDQRMGLSDEQRKALVAVLRANWKPGWSQAVEMNVRNGDTEMPGIPNQIMLPLLDRDQAEVWKQLPKLPEADPRFDPERMGAVGTPINDPETEF